jgi:hypothetical protein
LYCSTIPYDDVDNTVIELFVEFFLQLFFQIYDFRSACIYFKRKIRINLKDFSVLAGIDGINLRVSVIEANQNIQHYYLNIFGKRLACQVFQGGFGLSDVSAD